MNTRKLEERFFHFLMLSSTLLVVSSLCFILATVFIKGMPALSIDMLTKTPEGGYYIGKSGGILNSILGSFALGIGATSLALIISLPLVFYLHMHLRKRSRRGFVIRFFLDLLWGIPSVVYGAFGFMLMVFLGVRASLLAGIITVGFLVVPIMARSMDEALKAIPFELKEACLALGSTRLELAVKVIFKQALPGIVTAVLVAFGRSIGDAASVLFTAGFSDSLPHSLFKPVATLPLAIFFQLGTPFPEVQQRGYASAAVLTIIILCISIIVRFFSKNFMRHIVN